MKNNLNRIIKLIIYASDWPDIDGDNLTENEYRKFKSLSFILSSMAGTTTAVIMQSNEFPIIQTIFFSSISCAAGNYVAGKVFQYKVRKRKFESEKKIIYLLYRMKGLFNFLENNLIGKPTPVAIARLQCLEKELVEEDEADETLIFRQHHYTKSSSL